MKQAHSHSLILAAEALEYFPATSYFHKMAQADVFVLADELQFRKHAMINRCRIKTPNGAQWLTVPVRTKGRFGQKINEVQIVEGNDWRQKHWQCLTINYCRAAYFEQYADVLEGFFKKEWKNLADLNFALIEWLCRVLQIHCRLVLGSELSQSGNGRLLAWTEAFGANTYLYDASEKESLGVELKKLESTGIEVRSLEFMHLFYHQQFGEFMPHLSILDLILNEGAESGRVLRAGGRGQGAEG